MLPFFYIHAELKEDNGRFKENKQHLDNRDVTINRPCTTTTLTVFGKGVYGESIVVRINRYRIHFYASFRDRDLAARCCHSLLTDNKDRSILELTSLSGFRSMLLDNRRASKDKKDFADSSLSVVIRFRVAKRSDVTSLIEKIDGLVYNDCVKNKRCEEYPYAVSFYESNMDPIILATRALGLDACRWSYLNTTFKTCQQILNDPSTTTMYEYHVDVTGGEDLSTLFSFKPEADTPLPELPPFVRILSFDIECLSSTVDTMPDKDRDPIIQISSVVSDDALGRDTTDNRFRRNLFTLGGTCSTIQGVQVFVFNKEQDMLRAFVDHVQDEDPDILTGYNINNFDFPYIFKRFEHNDVVAAMGRNRNVAICKERLDHQQRRYASFMPKTHDTYIPGRVGFDMYTHMRKDYDLRSYTLNNVASEFLNKRKDDVSYKEIPGLFAGDADCRARLGHYCVMDAQLVLELAFKTHTFLHAFERCKVFRTMLQYLVDRGQQVKFYSLLLAWCSNERILVNDVTSRKRLVEKRMQSAAYEADLYDSQSAAKRRKTLTTSRKAYVTNSTETCDSDDEEDSDERSTAPTEHTRTSGGKSKRSGYEGATVLEPTKGIYHNPVVCLDYASLYPSIMIGYNLCFTTLVLDERHGQSLVDADLAVKSPIGHYFLKRSVKKGVLPSILEMLLNERACIRRRIKDVEDSSIEYKLLDGQQSALKIAANSIYGAIGCSQSVLNFVEIPASVTAYGRELILHTKTHVEKNYPGRKVLYGDTDSVMVYLSNWDPEKQRVWECAALGKEMADSVTKSIGREPIRLQFETVYKPFLLFSKKRYGAGVYRDLEKISAMDDKEKALDMCRPIPKYKGLQVVRRDNCLFSTRLMKLTLGRLIDETATSFDVESITRQLRDELKLLFDDKINTKELIISKEWKNSGGSNPQAHARLAQRMQRRDPNSAPSIGDRVPYIVVTEPIGAKLCDRAEDPLYALENGLHVDLLYYADNQVATPIAKLLHPSLKHQKSLEDVKDLFWPENAPRRQNDKREKVGRSYWTEKASKGSRNITEYFDVSFSKDAELKAQRTLTDVEDVLDDLVGKCMICKNDNKVAVKSCRNRDCETLYERFRLLRIRNDTKKSIRQPANTADNTCKDGVSDSYGGASRNEQDLPVRPYIEVFDK